MARMNTFLAGLAWVYPLVLLSVVIAIAAASLVGLVQVLSTRDDAFFVVDREKSKWSMLMGGALLAAVASYFLRMDMLWVIGGVIAGLYWFDVRPSIRDVLDNASGSW